ncbi:hypothetical protein GCM10018987_08840 [Streptomyces cremeus]
MSEIGPGGLRRLYGPAHEKDPMGLYEKLRAEHGPVAPVLLNGDVPAWLVLGHSENLHMTRTPSLYSRDSRRWRMLQDGSLDMTNPLAPIFAYQPVCVFADGAEHERQRGAVTDSIARIDHRGVRRFINRFSNRLVNDFCESGQADLVSQFAEHLPMMVMCQIIGMPEEYDEELVQAAREMLKGSEKAIAANEHVMGGPVPAGGAPPGGARGGLRDVAGGAPRAVHRRRGRPPSAPGADRRVRDDGEPDRQRAAHGAHRPPLPRPAQRRAHDAAGGGGADAVGRAAVHDDPGPVGRR